MQSTIESRSNWAPGSGPGAQRAAEGTNPFAQNCIPNRIAYKSFERAAAAAAIRRVLSTEREQFILNSAPGSASPDALALAVRSEINSTHFWKNAQVNWASDAASQASQYTLLYAGDELTHQRLQQIEGLAELKDAPKLSSVPFEVRIYVQSLHSRRPKGNLLHASIRIVRQSPSGPKTSEQGGR